MTFRDYAQGAFRMRGIGNGQKIILMIIPEVAKLISERGADEVKPAAAAAPVGGGAQDLLSMDGGGWGDGGALAGQEQQAPQIFEAADRALLVNVAAWLVINGMKSENLQFNVLCEQSVRNVWRKRAFNTLSTGYDSLLKAAHGVRTRRKSTMSKDQRAEEEIKEKMSSGQMSAGDVEKIKMLMTQNRKASEGAHNISLGMIQKCLDIFCER